MSGKVLDVAACRGTQRDRRHVAGAGGPCGVTMDGMPTELLTIAEVGRRLHTKPWPVYELVESGALQAERLAGRWLVRESDLERYLGRLFDGKEAPEIPAVSLADETRTLISVKEAAQHLDLIPASVYKLLDQGAIRAVYQGRRRNVVVDSLREYIDDLSILPPDPRW